LTAIELATRLAAREEGEGVPLESPRPPRFHRLRTNEPLTATDPEGLEAALVEIGDGDGETLLEGLLARTQAPSLAQLRAQPGGYGGLTVNWRAVP
jgi:hypothetical protein